MFASKYAFYSMCLTSTRCAHFCSAPNSTFSPLSLFFRRDALKLNILEENIIKKPAVKLQQTCCNFCTNKQILIFYQTWNCQLHNLVDFFKMLITTYLLAKIGADRAKNEQHFADDLTRKWQKNQTVKPIPRPGAALALRVRRRAFLGPSPPISTFACWPLRVKKPHRILK